MSEENVELAYRVIDAMNRRDLAAVLSLMDEDVEAVPRMVAVEGGLHGHDGIRRWWVNWFDAFPDYKIEVVDIRDHGTLIIGALRGVGHGAGSDLPLEDTPWIASRWRREKCVWWGIFNTAHEALEAAGLPE